MLLNKKGSTSYGFVALFFGVFLACFLVAEVNYKSIKKARSIMNFNENNNEELVIENTKKYINTYYKNIDVELIDFMEYANKEFNKITTKAYAEMAKKLPKAYGINE